MRVNQQTREKPDWLTAAVWLALTVMGLMHFYGVGKKWMALLAGVGVIVLLVRGDRKRLWNAPSLLLLGYAAWSWLTIFWAMSGKFHLREGSKILIAVFFFLLIARAKTPGTVLARRVTGVIAGMSAVYALMSVEAVSTGMSQTLLTRLFAVDTATMTFNGTRLSGIFGNSNIESSIYAAGILCAVALLCGTEKKGMRALYAAALSLNALGFLLVFSMGAMACFAAAVVVYLAFAGQGRSAALLRMLEGALPALAGGFAAFRILSGGNTALMLPVTLACAAATAALERLVMGRLAKVLERHEKLAFGVLITVAVLAGVYAFAALHVTGPYTFGAPITRTADLTPGTHTVQIEADGEVSLESYTMSLMEVLHGGATTNYNGPVDGNVEITIPEDAKACFFRFSAAPGVTLRRAVLDGGMELSLNYKLLPGFAAARVQYIGVGQSSLSRMTFWRDALRLFRLSPIVGSGVGAFETGVSRVQDYPYETRYVHNHYLQIMLEDGVIGLALYLGALAAMLRALWKKRTALRESGLGWLYPALWAAFVMNGLQMLWDVSMSMIIFVCMTYALYGLTTALCAEPLAEKTAEKAGGAKGRRGRRDASLLARNIGVGFTVAVVLTMAGNLLAAAQMDAPAETGEEFLAHLSTAAKLDLYEHNDAKLSYVVGSLEVGGESRAQADRYAAQLAKVQSNSIPAYLVSYYLQTQQYGAAIDEAILGATYSASDSDTWNSCCALLQRAFFPDGAPSAALKEDESLTEGLAAYRTALERYNASALMPVQLDEGAQTFFDEVAALERGA